MWDFGDGTTSTSASPVHAFTSSGLFDVTLIAFNGTNTDTAIYYQVEIFDAPNAAYTTDVNSGNAILTVNTINASTTGSGIQHWWNFGAGDPDEYATNTMHDYMNPGTYNMYLYVYDNNTGCSDTAYSVITVFPVGTSISETNSEEQMQIFPNPFSEQTTIIYVLKEESNVQVEIHNSIGQKIKTLVNATQQDGEYKFSFSAKELGMDAGIYFVKSIIDGKASMRKMFVI